MTRHRMHADEVDTDESLVRRLLAAQFPHWADQPIQLVPSAGTDNAIYRLGDDKVVRLPRIIRAVEQVEKEQQWLPRLAPHLPLAVPVPLARGTPAEGYPGDWSIYRWLEGEIATADRLADLCQTALALAQFLTALQGIDPTGGPGPGQHNFFRGVPLEMRDHPTRAAIATLKDDLDIESVTSAWDAALEVPTWTRPSVWIHGDIQTGNLLSLHGTLSAVIDFGALGVGDPACDLMIAWGLFSGKSRATFRAALRIDDATWARGRGWALSQALIFIPYYRNTNPVGVENAQRVLAEVLADHQHDA